VVPIQATSDRDIEEIMEHCVPHNTQLWYSREQWAIVLHKFRWKHAAFDIMQENPSFSWTTTALHLAMKEAIDAGLYDPSGYATDWATDYEVRQQ
jgi:hypothetical protein